MHYEKFADGTIKCIEDEIPFDLPEGWTWTRLGCICSAIQYGLSNSAEQTGTHRFLRITDIQDGKVDWESVPFTTANDDDTYLLKRGDMVFARTGATVGKSFLIDELPYSSVYASYLIRIRLIEKAIPEYVYQFFKSQCYWEQIIDKSVGVGQPNCNGTSLKKLFVPLPPATEQVKIVSAVQSVLKYVLSIEAEKVSLAETIVILKSKILDLAIRGKLIPQDPDDEPASVLLERIRAEKEDLIKQGKIKRGKKESVIFKGEDNSYYDDIPENWAKISLMTIAEVELGKTLDTAKNTGKYYPYLRSVNVKWNGVDLFDLKEMRFEADELERYMIRKGDLLICEGGDVGRCCIWDSATPVFYQNALHRVRFYGNCNPQFFLYHMIYLESIGLLKQISNGVTIKHLTKNVLASIPFLLPPLSEQSRIVSAIETYFSYLDQITESLV